MVARKPTLICISPLRITGFDCILPIMIELRKKISDIHIGVLFSEKAVFESFEKNSVHGQAFNDVVDSFFVFPRSKQKGSWVGIFYKIVKAMKLLPFIFRILLARKCILLHSTDLDVIEAKILCFFVKLVNGRIIGHPRSIALFEKRPLLEKEITSRSKIGPSDFHLYFSKRDLNWLNSSIDNGVIRAENIYNIGYPRFYDSWRDYLLPIQSRFLKAEFGYFPTKGNISLILPSTIVPKKGASKEDFEYLMTTAITAIRGRLPESLIAIKPHPAENIKNYDCLEAILKSCDVKITYLHQSLLSLNSCIAVTIFHSSVILDALAFRVPSIEYNRFSGEEYKERFPFGSLYSGIGMPTPSNAAEFECALDMVLDPYYVVPDVRNYVCHKKELGVFVDFLKR